MPSDHPFDPDSPPDVAAALARVTSQVTDAEERPGQIAMAAEVQEAIATQSPVVIEAGTGIGKSLAYLVPAVLSGKVTVVATATKALQDQLITKEITAIRSAAIPVTAAVLKGRLNYLCLKKLDDTKDQAPSLLSSDDVQIRKIASWAKKTETGERDQLGFEPSASVWASLSMSADECPGAERCPFGTACFAEKAKANAARSDVIIVNSALYGAHLSTGRTLLPPHATVIFDEAHELPDILSRALGVEINAPRVHAAAFLARSLSLDGLTTVLDALHAAADALGLALGARDTERVGIDSDTNEALVDVELAADRLFTLLEAAAGTGSGDELTRLSVRGVIVHLRADLVRFLVPEDGDLIFIEGTTRPTLICAPVEVGHLLAPLWAEVTPVFASATIPEGLEQRLGLSDAESFTHPSPFDYKNNALLYVPAHLSDRRSEESEDEIAEELIDLITAAKGRTLALFTSRRALEEIGVKVRARLKTPVLLQGERSRASLLEEFSDNEETSLFATMGFWQGVDIPGKTLSLLTIDRLPFSRPDDPMAQARRELAGSRAFYSVDLPRAAMLLAQGTGRLIRNATDCGVVAVFDTRLATASYKGVMLSRLPPMKRTTDRQVAMDFLATLE